MRTPAGRRIGILVGAYSLGHLQRFADRIARIEAAKLRIVDQRGNLVAAPGGVQGIVSFRHDDA